MTRKVHLQAALAMALATSIAAAGSQTTSFQGQLKRNGAPATGMFDFRFQLKDAASDGNDVGGLIDRAAVPVLNGLFVAELDWDASLFAGGGPLWVEVSVRALGAPDFDVLAPRTPIGAVPVALHALSAPGGGGGSLDDAYDGGGAGAGRAIVADAGRVEVQGPDGLFSLGGVETADVRIGTMNGVFDVDATRNPLLPELDDPPPTTVGARVSVIGAPTPESYWVAMRARRGRGQILHRSGTALEFVTESEPDASTGTTNVSIEGDGQLRLYGVNDAGTTNEGGNMVIGRIDGLNLALDHDEIMARDDGERAALSINKEGGDVFFSETTINGKVGIGTNAPDARFQVNGFTSATPTGGGAIQMGSSFGRNMVLDSNDIMVRDNQQPGVLFLNDNGGDVVVGGLLDIGLEVVREDAFDTFFIEAVCPSGKRLLGGGCWAANDVINISAPSSDTPEAWRCQSSDTTLQVVAHAYCARVK